MQNTRKRNILSAFATVALAVSALAGAPANAQSDSGDLPPGVVARQGGVEVTLQDLDAYAHKIPDKDRAGFFDSPQRIENTILGLLTQRQLAVQARAAKLDQDPDVQRQLALAEEDALALAYLMHYRKDMKLPNFDALAKEYYLAHQDEFGTKESRKSFEEVREALINKLRDRYIDAQTDQFTGELRSKTLDANPDLVASLRTRYLPPGAVLPSEAATEANEQAAKKKAAEQKAAERKAGNKP